VVIQLGQVQWRCCSAKLYDDAPKPSSISCCKPYAIALQLSQEQCRCCFAKCNRDAA
jgi:hypothetical protein